jgi:hypothetical protein
MLRTESPEWLGGTAVTMAVLAACSSLPPAAARPCAGAAGSRTGRRPAAKRRYGILDAAVTT